MLVFRLSTALSLAASCLVMASVIVPAPNTKKAITCEDSHNVHRLECTAGVIVVYSALYGRADSQTCVAQGPPPPPSDYTYCSKDGVFDVIKKRCDGKTFCEMNIKLFSYPDPCVGTSKYLQTDYACIPAKHFSVCEHSVAYLSCAYGHIISVIGADYGRQDQTTCSYGRPESQVENDDCYNPTTVVAQSCNGKNSCSIPASNSEFGDPCYGTYKYLQVAYVCQKAYYSGPMAGPWQHSYGCC